ncbi:contractile injection system tape measure protein [Pseudoalteromonas luteoviolacea]|uniref:contractile injection system tape measure protein n=1 Tax=Pseudoalteromonas luteoviolacea TaxID=43657 RepID=UPI001B38B71F|nr:contractile injection system tape measure protein [Pseudoalteromonas luteoviolacea]MBQ4839623.1 hypothetical protein [Pseudoalteromonas luteoviolacea]
MNLSIEHIGAELEAPSHLVDSGQHSIADLESLFKNWLHKEINCLQIEIPNVKTPIDSLTLNDIELELPDIDLQALKDNPSGYFAQVFSPVFYAALEQQLYRKINALGVDDYAFASPVIDHVLQKQRGHLSSRLWQELKRVCVYSLHNQPKIFLKLLNSPEWPSLRTQLIPALCQESSDFKALIIVVSAGAISQKSAGFISKLSVQTRIDLWADIELLHTAYVFDTEIPKQRMTLLAKAYQFYVEQSAFDKRTRKAVLKTLSSRGAALNALTTWFAIKEKSQLTSADCNTLTCLARKACDKSMPEFITSVAAQPYQQSVLAELLRVSDDVADLGGEAQHQPLRSTEYLVAQVRSQLGGGCRKTIRALDALLKLLQKHLAHADLPAMNQLCWFQYLAQHDIDQYLPSPILKPLQRFLSEVLPEQKEQYLQLRAMGRALTLIGREKRMQNQLAKPQYTQRYAKRIFALLCQIKNIPQQLIENLNTILLNQLGSREGVDLQRDISVYLESLLAIEAWLVRARTVADPLQNKQLVNEQPIVAPQMHQGALTVSNKTEADRDTAQEKFQLARAANLALSNVCTTEPSARFVFHSGQFVYMESVQQAQQRLTLSALSSQLNIQAKYELKQKIVGLGTTELDQFIQEHTASFLVEHTQLSSYQSDMHDDEAASKKQSHPLILDLVQICASLVKELDGILKLINSAQTQWTRSTRQADDGFTANHSEYVVKNESRINAGVDPKSENVTQRVAVDKSPSPHAQLDFARELLVVSQLKRYCMAFHQAISVNRTLFQLHGTHDVTVQLMAYIQSWQSMFTTLEQSQRVTALHRALTLSLTALNTLRQRVYALNPYIQSQAQKHQMWWLTLLDIVHTPEELSTKLAKENQQVAELETNEIALTSHDKAKSVDTDSSSSREVPLFDIGELQSAQSLTEATKLLNTYKTRNGTVATKVNSLRHSIATKTYDIAKEQGFVSGVADVALGENKSLNASLGDRFEKVEGAGGSLQQDALGVLNAGAVDKHVSRVIAKMSEQANKQQNIMLRLGIESLKTHSEQVASELKHQYQQSSEQLISDDAGVVLLWPFFEILFTKMSLLDKSQSEQVTFKDAAAQHKAYSLLCSLASLEPNSTETYVINALLGLPIEYEFEEVDSLNDEELDELHTLISAAIARWEALKGMPVESFKAMFLQRSGEVKLTANGVSVVVESKPQDVLLMKLPWGLGIVQLPWLGNDLVNIEWQYGF